MRYEGSFSKKCKKQQLSNRDQLLLSIALDALYAQQ